MLSTHQTSSQTSDGLALFSMLEMTTLDVSGKRVVQTMPTKTVVGRRTSMGR